VQMEEIGSRQLHAGRHAAPLQHHPPTIIFSAPASEAPSPRQKAPGNIAHAPAAPSAAAPLSYGRTASFSNSAVTGDGFASNAFAAVSDRRHNGTCEHP